MLYHSLPYWGRVLCALLVFCGGCTREKETSSSKIVARIDNDVLNSNDFADELARRLRSFDAVAAKNPERIKRVKDQALADFINRIIRKRWAAENKIKISDLEVDAEISRIEKSYPSPLAFRQSLANESISYTTWKNQVRDSLVEKALISILRKQIKEPTEDEALSFYKANIDEFKEKPAVRLRQIFLEKEDDARQIYQKIGTGKEAKDISDLAKKFSLAPEASKGGDLGWVEKGVLPVFDKAFALSKGAVTQVLKSDYGYHIIQLVDKRGDSQLKFADVKDRILATIRSDREQAIYSSWLENQLKHLKVQKNDELIRAITVETKR